MKQYLFIFLLMIVVLNRNYDIKEGFDGCEIHYNNRLQNIFEKDNNSYQLRGYSGNEYLYKMEGLKSKDPLPVNANFFLGKY